MRLGIITLISSCVGVGVFEILAHWYMSCDYPLSHTFLQWYIYRNSANKGAYYFLDVLFPAIVLGIIIGRVGWRWSIEKRMCFVVLAGLEVLAIELICPRFLNPEVIWWLPPTTPSRGYISFEAFWSIALVAIFSLFAYHYGRRPTGEHQDANLPKRSQD